LRPRAQRVEHVKKDETEKPMSSNEDYISTTKRELYFPLINHIIVTLKVKGRGTKHINFPLNDNLQFYKLGYSGCPSEGRKTYLSK
jgi:hypothetical protein